MITLTNGIIVGLAITLGGAGIKMARNITTLNGKARAWEKHGEHLEDIRERVARQETNMDWVRETLKEIRTVVKNNGTL
jgi:chaperone required for assembly of F1-ATPase